MFGPEPLPQHSVTAVQISSLPKRIKERPTHEGYHDYPTEIRLNLSGDTYQNAPKQSQAEYKRFREEATDVKASMFAAYWNIGEYKQKLEAVMPKLTLLTIDGDEAGQEYQPARQKKRGKSKRGGQGTFGSLAT
ncbi:hypothetical protein ACJZ2D_016347 [Fusarium nematophilum]